MVVDQTGDGVALLDLDGRSIVHANGSLRGMLGLEGADMSNMSLATLLPTTSLASRLRMLQDVQSGRTASTDETWVSALGMELSVELSMSAVGEAGGQLICLVVRDVTVYRRSEELILHIAHHDALTGLPNRTLFRERLEQKLRSCARSNLGLTVMFVDLDHFKEVNDSEGHGFGDHVLRQVAERMKNVLRGSDTLARQGGDEFLVLVDGGDPMEVVAGRLREAVESPVLVGGREVKLSASIGIAQYPHDGDSVDALIENADMAAYVAKNQGRNRWEMYSAELRERTKHRAEVRSRLGKAIQEGRLSLVFQPIVEMESEQVTAFEALVRWNDELLGPISPAEFIPVAEESGLVVPLGKWVMTEACRVAREWQREGNPVVALSVNVSPREFRRELADTVRAALNASGLDPHLLEIEVTETTMMTDIEQARSILNAVRGQGVTVAMDDFGVGYSSLGCLLSLPFDRIKMDRSLVSELSDRNHRKIVESVVELIHSIGSEVVAEGIETAEQLQTLRGLGVRYGQGFHLYRPMPAKAAAELLSTPRTPSVRYRRLEAGPPSYSSTRLLRAT